MEIEEQATDRTTQQEDESSHRIVVFAIPDDPHDLRDLLVSHLSLSPTDAQIRVQSLPGVLPDRLPKNDSAKVAAAIRELGVNAMSISDEEVPHLDHVEVVHHVRCSDSALETVDPHGRRESLIDWRNVALLSVGVLPQESGQRTTSRPMIFVTAAPHHPQANTRRRETIGAEALIITVNPFRVLRIHHAQMNYEYLGTRLTKSATKNFRRLVGDIVGHSAEVYITPATRAFVERGLLRHCQFQSAEEFRRYTLFHLFVRNSGRAVGVSDRPLRETNVERQVEEQTVNAGP